MIEVIFHIFTDAIPALSLSLGNFVVKNLLPADFIDEDSMLSGIIGFILYLIIISSVVAFLVKLSSS